MQDHQGHQALLIRLGGVELCLRPPRGRRVKGPECTNALRVLLPSEGLCEQWREELSSRSSRAATTRPCPSAGPFPQPPGVCVLITGLLRKESCRKWRARHLSQAKHEPTHCSPPFRGDHSGLRSLLSRGWASLRDSAQTSPKCATLAWR